MLSCGVALYTGGKDSHYAVMEALKRGVIVKRLVIVVSRKQDSWMFHTVNIGIAEMHAELMGMESLRVEVSGVKEVEVEELAQALEESGFLDGCDYIVTGAVASSYQKSRVDDLARRLGVKHLSPLWGRDQEALMREEIRNLSFIVTAVQAYGLPLKLLGKVIRESELPTLLAAKRKYGVSPVGEGGEFETLVITSPLFRGGGVRVRKARAEIYPNLNAGFYVIEDLGVY
ncbi:MAG: diphthine--ammonia ligase [Desulfurococcales archaeon]|nr:diphthine--ammonia ligase [Desulfurococcales archaeon]